MQSTSKYDNNKNTTAQYLLSQNNQQSQKAKDYFFQSQIEKDSLMRKDSKLLKKFALANCG